MGKYEPLTEFLRRQSGEVVRMSFAQIERIIGGKLPASAKQYRGWWSNNPNNSVMTKAWLDAGFQSEQVDMSEGNLTFRKIGKADRRRDQSVAKKLAAAKRHPLIGCMKGTIWIAPGTDLTKPAMPEWGEVAYGDKTWDDFK
jgi:hypothetical protein